MKLLILAFNPEYISSDDLVKFRIIMKDKHDIDVKYIPHIDDQAEPIYSIQWINDEKETPLIDPKVK